MKKIVLLHGALETYLTFGQQIRTKFPQLEITNLLDEGLLRGYTSRTRRQSLNRLLYLLRAVETQRPGLILCTSEVWEPLVAQARPYISCPVVSINDRMVQEAVKIGGEITILGTSPEPVSALLERIEGEAAFAGSQVRLTTLLCQRAERLWEKENLSAYDQAVTAAALEIKNQKAVVLAQTTMEHLTQSLGGICGCPILSPAQCCMSQIEELLFAGQRQGIA